MTDVVTMLRKIEKLRLGDPMPEEWGSGEWGTPLSKMCERWLAELVPVKVTLWPMPAPEPWGSPYAMNRENWT